MDGIENVVIVVVDALRADRVGAVGGEEGLTPNIDAVAESGTAFENAFACASNTDPSMTSLLTGRYPLNTVYRHGKLVTETEKRRIESVTPLPAVLSENGWTTATVGQALGRWHSRGFDHYPSTSGEDSLRTRAMDVAREAFDVVETRSPSLASLIRSIRSVSNREMAPRTVMQDYDPTTLLSRIDSRPFFGVVHLMETHKPYLGTTADFEELLAERDYPDESTEEFFRGRDLTESQRSAVVDSLDVLGLERPGELIALYDAAVQYADRKVGRLIDALREAGRWEKTALFVTADHGESLFDHGIFLSHHGLYDEVVRVPLISNLGGGVRRPEFVQLIDLAPTILELLEVDGPAMDGARLTPLLGGEGEWSSRDAVFAEEAYYQRRLAVRTDRWKYIRHVPDETIEAERGSSLACSYCDTIHGSERELYDLEADPAESENVIDEHPDTVDDLEGRYEAFESGIVDPGDVSDRVQYEHEKKVLDRLEAIGYR